MEGEMKHKKDERRQECKCDNFQIVLESGSDWECYGPALQDLKDNGIFQFSGDAEPIKYCPWCGKKLKKVK